MALRLLSTTVVPRATGYGFTVEAGQRFRFVMIEGAQILDVNLFRSAVPTEHYDSATQIALEGGLITKGTRIWGSPPASRCLALCTADTVEPHPGSGDYAHHISHSAHCTAHFWQLFAGKNHRPCYDNLRAGMAMLGLGQRTIRNSLNLFMKGELDANGFLVTSESDARIGDYIEFEAMESLGVALSVCPGGAGRKPGEGWDLTEPHHTRPVRIDVFETAGEASG